MKYSAETIKRVIFAAILLAGVVSCTSEDDIDEIFIEREWTLTSVNEPGRTFYTENRLYSILFADGAFTATTPTGNTITGQWKANGDTRSFACMNVRTHGDISKDTIALKMRDILTGAKSYSGTTLWLRIERDKKTYMLFGN